MRGETLVSTDRGSGPPVVLLHGQPGSGASWDPLSRLLEPEFRVLAPDRVGYGATGGEARGLRQNADIVADFIRDRDCGPATVVAHSWAGGVAVLLAVHHPEAAQSLVLVGAACTPDSLNALDRWLNVPGGRRRADRGRTGRHHRGAAADEAADPIRTGPVPRHSWTRSCPMNRWCKANTARWAATSGRS